jgi:hypothetical protein
MCSARQVCTVQETALIHLGKAHTLPKVKSLPGMKKARVYGNAVVLPDGKVFVTGGAYKPKEFSDAFAHYQPGTRWPLH